MLVNGIDMDTFLTHLRKMVMSAVIKQSKLAKQYETKDTKLAGDKYVAAIETGLYWTSYVKFDRIVLERAGVPNIIIPRALADKENIPPEYRERVIEIQRNLNISLFKEKNNYYRMLNGKPDIEDTDFIYAPENKFGISTTVPVHELDPQQAHTLTSSGIAEELIKKYPEKKYLKFLGPYGIPYYNSRAARNYDLLYILPTDQDYISNEFVKSYNEARDYVMLGLYTQNDNKLYEFYDEFMGFLIMIIAIQRFMSKIFKQGITRDFFDDSLIRYLYEGYNMPYFEDISIKYQRIISKELNLLLQFKSSNQGLYDVTNIFNFVKVNIYKYYLIKDYKKDSQGNPIIKYKTIVDEYGVSKTVIDYHNTFELWFQKVNIRDMDPAAAISDPSNKVDFWSVTGGDPYWINDSDLLEKIYRNNYNSLITKYMAIDIIYSMTKTMYESTYTIRMMIDNQVEMKDLKINLSRLTPDYVNLYETVIFLCALVSARFGLKGEIPLKGYQIANVYGFNFKADLSKIREDILTNQREWYYRSEYGKYIDPDILTFFTRTHAPTINDIDILYKNIDALRRFIDWRMRITNHLETYEAYKKLYDSLLITEDVKELYKKPNGEYGETYLELLRWLRPDLYEIIIQYRGNYKMIIELIDYVLGKLGKLSDDFKYIPSLNEKGDLIKTIEKLVNEFKSYTVSDADSGIVYILDDPHFNLLKILDKIKGAETDLTIDDRTALKYIYDDCISRIKITNKYSDKIKFKEEPIMVTSELINSYIKLSDKIALMTKDELIKDYRSINILDAVGDMDKSLLLDPNNKELLNLGYYYYMVTFSSIREKFPLSEVQLWDCLVDMILDRNLDLFNDISTRKDIMHNIVLRLAEYHLERIKIEIKHQMLFSHNIEFSEPLNTLLEDILELVAEIRQNKDMHFRNKILIREWFDRVLWIPREDRIKLVYMMKSLFKEDNLKDDILLLMSLLTTASIDDSKDYIRIINKLTTDSVTFDKFIENIIMNYQLRYKKYNSAGTNLSLSCVLDSLSTIDLSDYIQKSDNYKRNSLKNNTVETLLADTSLVSHNSQNMPKQVMKMRHSLKKTYS